MLIENYLDNKHIIDGKFSSNLTNKDKQEVWINITNKVNSVNKSGYQRDIAEVNRKLTTYKSDVRGKYSRIKRSQAATGGGSPIREELNEIEQLLIAKTNPETLDGIKGGIDCAEMTEIDEKAKGDDKDDVTLIEEKDLYSTPKREKNFVIKRKRISEPIDNCDTSKVIAIEESKLVTMEKLVEINKIKLKFKKIELTLKIKKLAEKYPNIDLNTELALLNAYDVD